MRLNDEASQYAAKPQPTKVIAAITIATTNLAFVRGSRLVGFFQLMMAKIIVAGAVRMVSGHMMSGTTERLMAMLS